MRCDTIWHDARLLTLAPGRPGLGAVERGAIAATDGRIVFAGAMDDAPRFDAARRVDCEGRWITPGLIDCHTHLVYGGDRAREFEQRLAGASYEEIARTGGGILSTVKATREASEDELLESALSRIDALIAEGITTIEIKSGYGLTFDDELKQLAVAKRIAEERSMDVAATYLAAHALPPEAQDNHDAFVDHVSREWIPRIARTGLADAVDGFCETIAFSPEQIARLFAAAAAHGLRVKLHADQLSDLGGAALAARFHALSADHLEWSSEAGIAAMGRAQVTAVLLPGAFYFLRETRQPPVEQLRMHHVPIAIATDCNPGTSPLTSLLLAMNMAATQFRLTVEECLAGATREAARALGRLETIGTLETGKLCDLAIWDVERPAELVYRMGFNPLQTRVKSGI